ncbi:hypothetical protein, partial [Mesorhizobium sp. M1C.F.Ca.ET.188.01.1.1]|uniref:hypothetical protein n=1 Tax=Mesorhizobium sp. M1C.F.Ca.ET.188.01.1.1 TaxID=2563924 RepID=UPI0010928B56
LEFDLTIRRKAQRCLGQRLKIYRARRARARSKATFIGVTGSSGKSTAASLLGHRTQNMRAPREIADQVIYVGEHAHRSKASQADRDSGRFVELRTPKRFQII